MVFIVFIGRPILAFFPNERIVGVAGHCPQDFMKWSQRLVVLLGSACRALNPTGSGSTSAEDAYSGPLSPAAGVLRGTSFLRAVYVPLVFARNA
ncbi:hypothetical protein M7I_4813 [Glarea lozoyensis 74030]|uniref:Uncharacterized protein n=1 Tax=Glarea lozoyensis (strain ATCC 74030 / MF5533) TaxID=1104152 RepID=H0EQ69_GLAL7|nr:hypothetical protein M7I_4813 [Glarea lozoyensis 74030]